MKYLIALVLLAGLGAGCADHMATGGPVDSPPSTIGGRTGGSIGTSGGGSGTVDASRSGAGTTTAPTAGPGSR